jgi:hypothetical protein
MQAWPHLIEDLDVADLLFPRPAELERRVCDRCMPVLLSPRRCGPARYARHPLQRPDNAPSTAPSGRGRCAAPIRCLPCQPITLASRFDPCCTGRWSCYTSFHNHLTQVALGTSSMKECKACALRSTVRGPVSGTLPRFQMLKIPGAMKVHDEGGCVVPTTTGFPGRYLVLPTFLAQMLSLKCLGKALTVIYLEPDHLQSSYFLIF